MGDEGAGHLYSDKNFRPVDNSSCRGVLLVYRPRGTFQGPDERHQVAAGVYRLGLLFGPVFLFRMELSQLRYRGIEGPIQVSECVNCLNLFK